MNVGKSCRDSTLKRRCTMTETQARYFDLYASGHTVTEIAQICGRTKSTISMALKAAKINRNKPLPSCPYHTSCFTCPFADCILPY